MESSSPPPSSFIPKKSLVTKRRSVAPFGFFLVGASALLFVTLASLGGMYGYRSLLQSEISRECNDPDPRGGLAGCGLEERIARRRLDLDEPTIERIKQFDAKLNRARDLFAGHNTILPLFALLEDLTLHSISFSSFNYNGETISIAGLARSYEGIALQSEVFNESAYVKKYVFSDFSSPSDQGVPFRLTLTIDPTITSYLNNQPAL